jgi:hypothetical protein
MSLPSQYTLPPPRFLILIQTLDQIIEHLGLGVQITIFTFLIEAVRTDELTPYDILGYTFDYFQVKRCIGI